MPRQEAADHRLAHGTGADKRQMKPCEWMCLFHGFPSGLDTSVLSLTYLYIRGR